MSMFVTIAVFAGIAAFDLPSMIKNKRWRDLAVYSAVFLPVFALGIVLALGIDVPSPLKAAQTLYKDVLGLSFKPE